MKVLGWDFRYRCYVCGGWFKPGNTSCCVAHAPGECCHHGDTPVAPPGEGVPA